MTIINPNGIYQTKKEKELLELREMTSQNKIIITGNGPSEWACARHWLLTSKLYLGFLIDMKNIIKFQKKSLTEAQKQAVINCWKGMNHINKDNQLDDKRIKKTITKHLKKQKRINKRELEIELLKQQRLKIKEKYQKIQELIEKERIDNESWFKSIVQSGIYYNPDKDELYHVTNIYEDKIHFQVSDNLFIYVYAPINLIFIDTLDYVKRNL